MIKRSSVWICVGLLTCSASCYAQNKLTLTQVYASTINHFPVIKAAEQNIAVAEAHVQSAKGAFDPSITSSFKSTPGGGYENAYDQTQLDVPLMYGGGHFFAGYRIGRGDWPTYYQNYRTNSAGEVVVGLDMPLLRDFKIDPSRAKYQSSLVNIGLQHDLADQIKIDTLQQAGYAYWAWVASASKLRLVKQLLDLALNRQKALLRRYHLGDAANIEFVENKRFILQRKAALVYAKLEFTRTSNFLSLYYRNKLGKSIVPTLKQVPNTLFHTHKIHLKSLLNEEKYQMIYSYSPKLSLVAKKIQLEKIKLELAKNDLMPSLDASIATQREFGNGGDPLLKEGALDVGLTFSIDFPRNIAKGQNKAAKNNLLKYQIRRHFFEQDLKVDYINVVNELSSDSRQVSLLNQEVGYAKQVERAEIIRFKEGDSSLFLVNQREQATFSAKLDAIDAALAYQKSMINLQKLCGFSHECYSKLVSMR